ncbi:MAG: hypothetical protein HOC79_04065 [Euryarchaeota archaeon]|nr:hypothetical protein [Euryarchaeota archaeon]
MSEYERGFSAGYLAGWREGTGSPVTDMTHTIDMKVRRPGTAKKRKPTAYNNFVSKKSQLPRYKYKSTRGKKKKGMTNLKAIGIAWRKLSKAQQNKYK